MRTPETYKKWYQKNKKKLSAYTRNWRFGPGAQEHFKTQFRRQGRKCAVCRKRITMRAYQDHCHKTNKLRGALCGGCNLALGRLERVGVEKFAAYLKRWKEAA